MAEGSAKEVKVTANLSGQKIHPTHVTLSCTLNGMAQGSITYIHKSSDANSKATNLSAKEVFTALGQRQTATFMDVTTSPKAVISVNAGSDGSIRFAGATSDPNYSFSVDSIELTEAVNPDYATLNCFDLSIYGEKMADNEEELDDPPDNIAEWIIKIIDKRMKDGKELIEEITDETSKKCAQKQHAINEKAVTFVKKLFQNSTSSIGWKGVLKALNKVGGGMKVKERILAALISRDGGFFNNILRLCEEFQWVYVPEFSGVGKLVNCSEIFNNPSNLKLHPVSLSAHCGSLGMFPIRAVKVVGIPLSEDTDEEGDISSLSALFPEDVDQRPGGTILQVQGPQWLSMDAWESAVAEMEDAKAKKQEAQKGTLDLQSDEEEKKKEKSKKKHREACSKIILTWAKTAYYWHALGQTYAIINGELNLKPRVGYRYNVTGDSGKLFSGILNSISHNIVSSAEGADATTTYEFSHVIMGNAKIPRID